MDSRAEQTAVDPIKTLTMGWLMMECFIMYVRVWPRRNESNGL
jgi:hypothetical protein